MPVVLKTREFHEYTNAKEHRDESRCRRHECPRHIFTRCYSEIMCGIVGYIGIEKPSPSSSTVSAALNIAGTIQPESPSSNGDIICPSAAHPASCATWKKPFV